MHILETIPFPLNDYAHESIPNWTNIQRSWEESDRGYVFSHITLVVLNNVLLLWLAALLPSMLRIAKQTLSTEIQVVTEKMNKSKLDV